MQDRHCAVRRSASIPDGKRSAFESGAAATKVRSLAAERRRQPTQVSASGPAPTRLKRAGSDGDSRYLILPANRGRFGQAQNVCSNSADGTSPK